MAPENLAQPNIWRRSWSWLLWWRVDQSDLDEQVEKYNSLGVFKTARGQSVLCLLFSVAATIAMVLLKVTDQGSYVDAAVLAAFAVFIYFGHRWAIVAAMTFWTLEKGYLMYLGVTAGASATASNPVVQLIWWCIYMQAFYFALRVEREKRKRLAADAAS
jgi:hypothetical protein